MDILIVEDNQELRELLSKHLVAKGWNIDEAVDGQQGLRMALEREYGMLILDVNLPKMNGTDLCRAVREERPLLPILMLTSNDQELQIVDGLANGADDYVTKPFRLAELLARIEALLRRTTAINSPQQIVEVGQLRIDPSKVKAWLGEKALELTRLEFDLLYLLSSKPGQTFSRSEILTNVWGVTTSGYQNAVNSTVLRLRRKIESDVNHPSYLLTVRGYGYRFATDEELATPSK